MSFDALKQQAWSANQAIVRAGLVVLTWGNASAADREAGVMAIKPSGVDYDRLQPDDIVVLDLETGKTVEGTCRPSSDTPTHLYLYQSFPSIGGIVHTHSACATSWAQARRPIPCLGTTHADHFYGEVPVTRAMHPEEIRAEYEKNTGVVIVEHFRQNNLDALEMPAVLVANHAPFTWGTTAAKAVENAIALEASARMARDTFLLNTQAEAIAPSLLDKHFLRKHGAEAYYGQPKEKDC